MATHRITGARRVASALVAALLAAMVTFGATSVSTAQDERTAYRDLATATDFRLRVAAALALGKSKSPGARLALQKALGDSHQAVRTAAAAALAMLGDPAAIPALQTAAGKESVVTAKSQMEASIAKLSASPNAKPKAKAKFLVALGKLENKSGVASTALLPALKDNTRSRVSQIAGVDLLADGTDLVAEGKSRNLPALALDGSLTKLAKQQGTDGIGYAARVEFVIRRMPGQTLKGTMNGAATALADAREVKGQAELGQLQLDALAAAVDTALKNASGTLEAAAK